MSQPNEAEVTAQPSPLMRRAEAATKIVAGWSKAKQAYARRITAEK